MAVFIMTGKMDCVLRFICLIIVLKLFHMVGCLFHYERKVFCGTSVPVNKSLLKIFMAAKYPEQSGHGIPAIVEKYGRDVFFF